MADDTDEKDKEGFWLVRQEFARADGRSVRFERKVLLLAVVGPTRNCRSSNGAFRALVAVDALMFVAGLFLMWSVVDGL